MTGSGPAAPPCDYLDWDSTFFECRIARARTTRVDQVGLEQILAWCAAHRIECLYQLIDSDDASSVPLLEGHGFRLVDVRVTLDRHLWTPGAAGEDHRTPAGIRPSRPEDVAALRAIARRSHRDTRFYYDARFPRERCDALYETWIEKSCHGYADIVLVAESDAQAAGYLSCHLLGQGDGQIGLLGVGAAAQGAGVGRDLVQAALCWFVEQGRTQVSVVTQGRNVRAQRLYQRCGFVTRSLQLWYHRWGHERAA